MYTPLHLTDIAAPQNTPVSMRYRVFLDCANLTTKSEANKTKFTIKISVMVIRLSAKINDSSEYSAAARRPTLSLNKFLAKRNINIAPSTPNTAWKKRHPNVLSPKVNIPSALISLPNGGCVHSYAMSFGTSISDPGISQAY